MSLSVAQTLPVDVLLLICQLATDPHPSYFAHGGRLAGSRWDSNEQVHPLTLVCRNWTAPANTVLYESVSILDGPISRLFARTIALRPYLATLVRKLVVGLKDKEDELSVYHSGSSSSERSRLPSSHSSSLVESESEARADSFVLASIIAACEAVHTLQIRTALHRAAREHILPLIASREYETLICAPRLVGTAARWGDGFYRPADVLALARKTLAILEIECALPNTGPPQPAPGSAEELGPAQAALALRALRLECNVQPDLLRSLLRRAHRLEHLDLYTERITTADDAFSTTSDELRSNLKSLKFLVNPHLGQGQSPPSRDAPVGAFLGRFGNLTTATVSSAEVSAATLLRSLPVSLKTLEIIAFGQSFAYHPNLLAALRDRHQSFGAFGEWQIVGSDWTDTQVREVTEACESRRIRFIWAASSSEGETFSTGSSGRGQDG